MEISETRLAQQGLRAQRLRMRAALTNLSRVHASAPPGQQPPAPVAVTVQATETIGADGPEYGITADMAERRDAAPRLEYDPSHPDADANGMVRYADIDPVGESIDLMSASRTYEATIRAWDVVRQSILNTLEIGK